MTWGSDTRPFPVLFASEPFRIGPIPMSPVHLWSFVTVVLLLAAFSLFFKFSLPGMAMRATADNQQVAQSLGVSVKGIFALSWCIATVVSALGGIILGSVRGGVDFSLADLGLKVFPVVILGGLDSVAGAIIGGVLIGVLENLSGGYLDPIFGGGVKEVAPFVVLVVILMMRPYGFFGKRRDRAGLIVKCGGFRVSYRGDERIFEHVACRSSAWSACSARWRSSRCFAGTYWLDVLNRIGIAIIGALGLNILVGYTGPDLDRPRRVPGRRAPTRRPSSRRKAGLPFYLAIPLAALLTSAFGLVFGIPSLRLKGLYLAIATLAAHFITTYVIIHWESMTNGVLGFNVPPATVFGVPLDSDARVFYLIFALVVPATLFAKNLFRTRVGRAFIAMRDRDVAAARDGGEPLSLQAPGVRDQLVLRGRGGRADGPPLPHPVPRRLHPARGHRLPGHDHHRRHGQHPRVHLRRGLHDAAARGAEARRDLADRRVSQRLRADRLGARHRLRPGRHLLPDVRARWGSRASGSGSGATGSCGRTAY